MFLAKQNSGPIIVIEDQFRSPQSPRKLSRTSHSVRVCYVWSREVHKFGYRHSAWGYSEEWLTYWCQILLTDTHIFTAYNVRYIVCVLSSRIILQFKSLSLDFKSLFSSHKSLSSNLKSLIITLASGSYIKHVVRLRRLGEAKILGAIVTRQRTKL